MRHRKQGRSLSRTASHRRAMLTNLAASVLTCERVETTTAKAKEARTLVERLITCAKRNDLHARRQVLRVVKDRTVVSKLFDAIAPRYTDRTGGYTRIIHTGQRRGDAAEISILELVDRATTAETAKTDSKKPGKKEETAGAEATKEE